MKYTLATKQGLIPLKAITYSVNQSGGISGSLRITLSWLKAIDLNTKHDLVRILIQTSDNDLLVEDNIASFVVHNKLIQGTDQGTFVTLDWYGEYVDKSIQEETRGA